jgi:hypothetical protein
MRWHNRKEKGALMKYKSQLRFGFFLFAVLVASSATIRADAVADWNLIAVQTTAGTLPGFPPFPPRPGPTGNLDVAVVQAAVYDAVQAIEKKFAPYYVEIPGASGSPVAATAKAAHDVLVNRFPSQALALDTIYFNYMAPLGLLDDPGVAVGARAAAGIIALRACDGSFPNPAPPPFVGIDQPGFWRPTPGTTQMTAPWVAFVTPFTLTRPSQFRADPPPALTSREYARNYNEVMALGALNNSDRTPQQTDLAHFWFANYTILLNQVLRDIANAHVDNIAESARLFALADMAIADALITAWSDKVHYVFWRPITAIQQGDNDDNSRTIGDPGWQSLYPAPPYPDYTSGANITTSALINSLKLFFDKDRMDFSITTTNTGPTIQDTRTYRRFSEVTDEVVDARIYEGIHFRFADTAARQQGRQVARFAFKNFLRPLPDDDEDEDDHDH